MTREELADRIEKTNGKIAKIEKRIDKWTAGMNDEAKKLVAACELVYDNPNFKANYEAYRAYGKDHENDATVYNPNDWNKGPQYDEAYRAYRDLADAKNTLHKYETSLNKLVNFDNAEKIETIWAFLQQWKRAVKEYIIDGCDLLGRLKAAHSEALEAYKRSQDYTDALNRYKQAGVSEWRANYQIEQNFNKEYYQEVPSLSYKFYTRHGQYDDAALEKFLDAEVRAKYQDLVNRITEIAGEIIDASNLYIANDGNINGIVKGTKCPVKVETIGAGGYNIQRFHYRVLVHPIRQ